MSNYPQYFLTTPIAVNGDKTIPPATAQEAGTGRLSQEQGWGSVNAMPINEGGVPPKRDDFNGALYILSAYLVWIQQGGLFNYSPNYDYEVGNEVMYQGVKYRALQANGPSSALKTPGTDATVWKNMDANVPAGACVPFANVTLGGSDGRRPIFWGKTQADEGWVLADGGSDGQGGTVPNLLGKSIEGSNPTDAGGTSGGTTVSTSSGIPVGSILLMAGTLSDPNGEYVQATASQSLDIASYQEAYASLGTTWGTGESGKFLTPSFNDRWLKMSGTDTLGTNLEAGLPDASGYFGTISYSAIGGCFKGGGYQGVRGSSGGIGQPVDFKLSYGNPIFGRSEDVQPRSVVVTPYIRVRNSSTGSGTTTTGVRYKLAYFVKLPE